MENSFENFKNYAFRLELLQEYIVEEERGMIKEFIASGKIDIDGHKEWLNLIRDSKNRGAKIIRVHVVDYPLSSYLEYELEVYRYNQQEGEEIYLISRNDFEMLKLDVDKDFWLFDDIFAVDIIYSDLGEYIRIESIKEDISNYINIKNKLLSVAKHLDG